MSKVGQAKRERKILFANAAKLIVSSAPNL